MDVLVYAGRGASPLCIQQTILSLRQSLSKNYSIKQVDHRTINTDPWHRSCALLVLPGGQDIPYTQDITAGGMERIRAFVREGGRYLGICAGAYYGMGRIRFGEIVGERLGLVEGVAVGPYGGKYSPEGHSTASLAPLDLDADQTASVYVNGGCWFEAASNTTIMAQYSTTQEPAIIKASYGMGTVILSGPHIEFSPGHKLIPLGDLPFSHCDWVAAEGGRSALWEKILSELGLKVHKPKILDQTPILVHDFSLIRTLEKFSATRTFIAPYINPVQPVTSFDQKLYLDAIGSCHVGQPFMYAERIDSTQTALQESDGLLQSLPEGTVLVAGEQIAGRGRGSNSWISSTGALQFTLIQDHHLPTPGYSMPMIQYLMAISICEAITSKHRQLDVRIKWPNDIYARLGDGQYKKMGGILVTSVGKKGSSGNKFRLLIGVGLNVEESPGTISLNDLTRSHGLPVWPKETLLADLMHTFSNLHIAIIVTKSFPSHLYYRHWLHSDQLITIESEQIKARIEGIDKDGYLIAQPVTEGLHTLIYPGACSAARILLQPDGNSFDLMHNLIRRKC